MTLRPYRTPEQGIRSVPVGYPTHCSLEHLFPDARLRSQLARWPPVEGYASLNIHNSDGWGGVIVSLNRGRCQDIELGWTARSRGEAP